MASQMHFTKVTKVPEPHISTNILVTNPRWSEKSREICAGPAFVLVPILGSHPDCSRPE